MTQNRPSVRALTAAAVTTLGSAGVIAVLPATAAHAANVAPTIVTAAMVDTDLNDHADRVRLTYSEPISHPTDSSAFPFTVSGYTVTKVDAATDSKVLVIEIAEKATTDITAVPSVKYVRTTSQPVTDADGLQAAGQTFTETQPLDRDGDGVAAKDCGPTNPAINPAAVDVPDLAFVDKNCDGIDGDAATAIFLDANTGKDVNPGTKNLPVGTLAAAFNLHTSTRKAIYANSISSPNAIYVNVPDGVNIYGGYDRTWQRSHVGTPTNGLLWRTQGTNEIQLLSAGVGGKEPALRVTGGTLRLVEVDLLNSFSEKTNSVALIITGGAKVTAIRGSIKSGQAASAPGNAANGSNGTLVSNGGPGQGGSCDTFYGGDPGYGGGWKTSAPGWGGNGGLGGRDANGNPGNGGRGDAGSGGAAGGTPGLAGNPGKAGGDGTAGANGVRGVDGKIVKGSFLLAGFTPATSTDGTSGTNGAGGGGGGGGGGQVGATVISGMGNGGGGGGQGGRPGSGGRGGMGGYASIAAYVPLGSLVLDGTAVVSGQGGNAGKGGVGGLGNVGGAGGAGGSACLSEVGRGGKGGAGGRGGNGGNGAPGQAGPSIGIFAGPYSLVDATDALFTLGNAGTGALPIRANVYRP